MNISAAFIHIFGKDLSDEPNFSRYSDMYEAGHLHGLYEGKAIERDKLVRSFEEAKETK